MERIQKVLVMIKEQSGMDLILCDHFAGVRGGNRNEYFNVILKDSLWKSLEYAKLTRLVNKGILFKIKPNGVNRVAIYFKNN